MAAFAALPGIEDHRPDIDVRPDGVTIRLLTNDGEYYGMSHADVAAPRRSPAPCGRSALAADPTDVQSILIVPGAADTARIMPFWEAATGYVRRPDSPDEDLLDPHNRWPGLWFEEMGEPRSNDGGGAVHIGVFVPVGQGQARVDAALARGRARRHAIARPMWWTLADEAGNELDIGTLRGAGLIR